MDEQKKKKIDRTFFRLSILPLAGAVGYMLYSAFIRKKLGIDYYVILFLGLGLHWLLADVLSVIYSKGFEGKTDDQKKAYRMYSVMNLVGFAGLGFFACSVGSNAGLIGAMVYVVTLNIKRKFLEEYKGTAGKEEEEPDQEETEADPVVEESETVLQTETGEENGEEPLQGEE